METTEIKTENLKALRELRTQEKAIKARIDEISPKAADEAVAILAEKGQDRGEFEALRSQEENQSAERCQSVHRKHGRFPQNLRRTQPRQRTRRDQTDGQGHRLKEIIVRTNVRKEKEKKQKIKENFVVERLSA